MLPARRTDKLVVETIGDEIVVYDLVRHKAHCLSPTAALVWTHCDGATPVSRLAELLGEKLNLPTEADIVWAALAYLEHAQLMKPQPKPASVPAYSRREWSKVLVAYGVSSLLVTSITAPAPAQAASCNCNVTPCQTKHDCVNCPGFCRECVPFSSAGTNKRCFS